MSLTIYDGQQAPHDPTDSSVFVFDWDAIGLPAGVTIADYGFTTTYVRGGARDVNNNPTVLLVVESPVLLSGLRKVQVSVRMSETGLGAGSIWRVANRIVTNETTPQTKERSFFVKVGQL